MMGCEFHGCEIHTTGPHAGHQREFCVATGEACLVDDPLGYIGCTRRTFLMLQGAPSDPPDPRPVLRRKARPPKEQGKLL